jgi:hypothetical protein
MKNQLSEKEIKSLLSIIYKHYPIEQFDDKNSYASNLIIQLENILENK